MRRWMGTLLTTVGFGLCSCGGGDEVQVTTTGRIGGEPSARQAEASGGSNLPPRIESLAIEPSAPGVGDTVRAVAEATDPEGDAVRFVYAWTLNGEPAGGDARLRLANTERGDLIEVEVRALDAWGESPPSAVTARVSNRPPVLRGVQVDPARTIPPGHDVVVTADGEDPDGDRIDYEYTWWVNDEQVDAEGPVFRTGLLSRGDTVRVSVVATDGRSDSAPLASPAIPVGNAGPKITSQPGAPGPDGIFRYQIRAEDPEGGEGLRYRLANAPDGMTVTPLGGQVQWAPRPDQTGRHAVKIVVEDTEGATGIQTFELIIGSPAAPAP